MKPLALQSSSLTLLTAPNPLYLLDEHLMRSFETMLKTSTSRLRPGVLPLYEAAFFPPWRRSFQRR
jgi:hypothetical protein